jgi:hypothetical protein
VLLQIATLQGSASRMSSLTSSEVFVRTSFLKFARSAFDHGCRAVAISGNPLESALGPVEIGLRAIEKGENRIGAHDHSRLNGCLTS